MQVHKMDPLQDGRWSSFLERHRSASLFHTVPWLEALRRTYGYEAVVYTTARPGEEMSDGIVLCRVNSVLTGRRLVSLPFSDHCEPLVSNSESAKALFASVKEDSLSETWRYVEIRPREELNGRAMQFKSTETYYLHDLDVTPDLDTLFQSFHRNCVQRKIKRAENEGLIYVEGRSDILLTHFYDLLLLTRHRHQIPPQPRKWFSTLIDCFGEALKIRLVYKEEIPIAGILTITFKDKMTYKFGCSNASFHNLGGIHFLFWKSIQDAKQSGVRTFDLGRSEILNTGLITFKDRWGANRTSVTYYAFSTSKSYAAKLHFSRTSWTMRLARQVFGHAPEPILLAVGNLFYRHIG